MNKIVFCDFDGTITEEDQFEKLLRKHSPGAVSTIAKIHNGEISLKDGVKAMVAEMPSSLWSDLHEHLSGFTLRPGFGEFVDYLEEKHVPLVIVSGGIRAMIEETLMPYRSKIHGIIAAEIDDSDEYLRAYSNFEDEVQLVAKDVVMENFAAEEMVMIGDSTSDFAIAKKAHVVFARDRLANFMEQSGLGFKPWQDFHDIKQQLELVW